MRTQYAAIPAYKTKDGSEIRELMHPAVHGNSNQSLAEAIVRPGERTLMHLHRTSEELYHVTDGEGVMTLAGRTFRIGPGDTVLIPPGAPHCVEALGERALHILCCSSPPYRHDDTSLVNA
jgi:mannose-6-phosphate isomerase-like protein (cupin superfamily)